MKRGRKWECKTLLMAIITLVVFIQPSRVFSADIAMGFSEALAESDAQQYDLLQEADAELAIRDAERLQLEAQALEAIRLQYEQELQRQAAEQLYIEQFYENIVQSTPLQGNILIPAGFGDVYTVTCYGVPGWYISGEWRGVSPGTMQDVVHNAWIAAGAFYNDGLAVLDGRYLIACTPTFGNVGDAVTFYLQDGTPVPCVIADAKAQSVVAWDTEPANEWGHSGGRNIVEFEVDPNYYLAYGNPGQRGWHMEFSQPVTSALWEGQFVF